MTVQGEAALWYHMKFFTTSYILSREHLEGRDRRAQFPQYGLFYNREGVVRRRAEAKCKGETARERAGAAIAVVPQRPASFCAQEFMLVARSERKKGHTKSL